VIGTASFNLIVVPVRCVGRKILSDLTAASLFSGRHGAEMLISAQKPNPGSLCNRKSGQLMGDMTDISARLRCQRLRVFSCLMAQAARTLVLFIFEPSDVFRGIGEALQPGFQDGGIGDLI
jgi:hypothetical protein